MPNAPLTPETDADAKPKGPAFADLGLPEFLCAQMAARGITVATPVQAGVIPLALAGMGKEGGDILAQARTGSGKTLAFLLPLAAAMQAGECARAWVVCPTRELAQQVAREGALVLGQDRVATLVGGSPWPQQSRELSRKPPLVVGTPGRMCDHLQQGTLKADAEVLVLDEADQMLDMGFKDELDTLVKDLGQGVARWLFSATFPGVVADAVERWLDNPRRVKLDEQAGASHVPQKFVTTGRGQELAALVRLLQVLEPARALVFTRTRLGVDEAAQAIALAGIEAGGISGDLTQEARERVLGRFRQGKLPVLVATDVAARGLDVQGVSHVFNLGLPVGAASYTHRVGRTARAGAAGEAWSVISNGDRGRLLRLAQLGGCRPVYAEVPTAGAITAAKRARLATRIGESLGESLKLPAEFNPLVEAHGAEAVLAALVHRLVPDAAKEMPAPARAHTTRGANEVVGLFLGIGLEDGVSPAAVVAMVCRAANIPGHRLGKLRLHPRHCLLEVPADAVESVLGAALHYRGRRIPVRQDAHHRGAPGPGDFAPKPRFTPPAEPAPRAGAPVAPVAPRPAPPIPPAPAPAPRPAPVREAHAERSEAPRRETPARHEAPARHDAPRPEAPRQEARPPAPVRAPQPPRPAKPPAAVAPDEDDDGESDGDGDADGDVGAPPKAGWTPPARPPALPTGVPMVPLRLLLGPGAAELTTRTLRKYICKAAKVSKNAIGKIAIQGATAEVELRVEPANVLLEEGWMMVKDVRAQVLPGA